MGTLTSKYSVELYDPTGLLLADLSGRAQKRTLTLSRNEADDIQWSLDLAEFEKYCRQTNQDPRVLLLAGRNEIRIRRRGRYLAAGQISYYKVSINDRDQSIEVRAAGFLNLLKYRFTSAQFLAADGADIAWDLINSSQSDPFGDFGITRGIYESVGLYNKTYDRTALKDALQDLTKSLSKGFDMEFTPEKVFNIYKSMGTQRKEIQLEYPGNILSLDIPNDATNMANEIIGIGSGNGDQVQTVYTGTNDASKSVYATRQKFLLRSATDNDDGTLTDAVNSELDAWGLPFEIPSLTIDGNKAPFVSDFGIGDRVHVKINNHPMLAHVDGFYRIEKIVVAVDDNDNETVTLSVSA